MDKLLLKDNELSAHGHSMSIADANKYLGFKTLLEVLEGVDEFTYNYYEGLFIEGEKVPIDENTNKALLNVMNTLPSMATQLHNERVMSRQVEEEDNIELSDIPIKRLIDGLGTKTGRNELTKDYPILLEDKEATLALLEDIRNYLLNSCDWTQVADAPLSETQRGAWQRYRQELRDWMNKLRTKNSFIDYLPLPSKP